MNIADELRKRLQEAEDQRRLDAAHKLVQAYGPDNFPDETALRFQKAFAPEAYKYTYLALKADGRWYLTGNRAFRANGWSWDELMVFLAATGEPTTTVHIWTVVQGAHNMSTLIVGDEQDG